MRNEAHEQTLRAAATAESKPPHERTPDDHMAIEAGKQLKRGLASNKLGGTRIVVVRAGGR